jgi:hypothetical protein
VGFEILMVANMMNTFFFNVTSFLAVDSYHYFVRNLLAPPICLKDGSSSTSLISFATLSSTATMLSSVKLCLIGAFPPYYAAHIYHM